MNIDKHSCLAALAAAVLPLVLAAPLIAADEEDFNWTEASQFVDSFPFKQSYIDSLAAARHVVFPSSPLRTVPQQGFAKGELLVYDIGWSFVRAGYVILTATPDAPHRTIKLGAKALSRGFVSTFYRMRDYAISTVDAEGLYPLYFEEHLREGKHYKSNSLVLYDNAKDTLYVKERSLRVPKFTNDYISVLYLARTKQFAPGDTFSLPFFVDGKLYRLMFSCKKRETIAFNGKDIGCLVVQPQPADDKGAFNKKKGLEIWFSDDASKIPLKIKAKITIGSITANLVHAERPKSSGFTGFTPVKAEVKPRPPDTVRLHAAAKMTVPPKTRDSLRTGDTSKTLDRDARQPSDTMQVHDAAETAAGVSNADIIFKTEKTAKSPDTADVHDPGNKIGTEPVRRCSRDNSY